MGAVTTTLKINDRISKPLQTIAKNIEVVTKSMETANKSVDTFGNNFGKLNFSSNINKASSSQSEFNRQLSEGNSAAQALNSTLKKVAATYLGIQSIGKLIETSDFMASSGARLDLMSDGKSTNDELKSMVWASANEARASYADTLNQVAKLGTNAGKYFGSNAQIVKFVEEFNKLGRLSGASVYESSQAMYQLTQSMAKGRLDGDELRSVMEGMPLVTKTIADYLGVSTGKMKEMAADGKVTANVVREALLGAAADTDAKFGALPMTFEQTWQVFKNNATIAFEEVTNKINDIVNSNGFQQFAMDAANAVQQISIVVSYAIDVMAELGKIVYDNWSTIAIVLGIVVAALVIYNTMQAISAAVTALSGVAFGLYNAAVFIGAVAIGNATAAQTAFNAALYACPVVWIITLIIGAVIAIGALILKFSDFENSSTSVLGKVVGNLGVLKAFFVNLGETIKIIFSNIGTFFTKAFYGMMADFANFKQTIIEGVIAIAEMLNKLPFVEFDMTGLYNASSQYAADAWEYEQKAHDAKYTSLSDAWEEDWAQKAYDAASSKVDSTLTNLKDKASDALSLLDGLLGETVNVADNTEDTNKNLKITKEDIKYLRDISEREAVNRYTTVPLKVEFNNTNNVSSDMDVDGIINTISNKLVEAVNGAAEVVHY